jgi:hypothetical protein
LWLNSSLRFISSSSSSLLTLVLHFIPKLFGEQSWKINERKDSNEKQTRSIGRLTVRVNGYEIQFIFFNACMEQSDDYRYRRRKKKKQERRRCPLRISSMILTVEPVREME